MAIVPMTEGPKVNPTVPDAKPISILEPKESKIAAQSIANAQASSNGLLKAARESYERMSDARATEAYNNVRIAVTDLLMGENGALTKKGTEVTDSKKPFVDDYYEKIQKIFDENTKDLDTYQKQLLEGRKQKYLANRRIELTQHLIKEADAKQKGIAKTAAEIASENIQTNPRDLDSVKESREEIAKNFRILLRGQDESVIQKSIDDTVSASLSNAIELALANNNPEEAEALRKHYHKQGLSYLDELKLQPKIREALQKKIENANTVNAVNATKASLTPEAILARTLPKGNGKEFDAKKYKEVADIVTENGLDANAVPYLYLLGDWGRGVINDWKAEKEKALKEGTVVPAPPSLADFKAMATHEQTLAVEEYARIQNGVNSGDKEIIKEQVLTANPNIDYKTMEATVKQIHENRQQQIALYKAQSSDQASQTWAMVRNGTRWKDIPETEKAYLSKTTRAGLEEYDRRKALNSFTTDSVLYDNLAFDNENLKRISWETFYGFAGYLKPSDFSDLLERKRKLENMGDKELNDLHKNVSKQVDDALSRLGIEATTSDKKRVFGVMKRVIFESVYDAASADPTRNWSDADIRKLVNGRIQQQFITYSGTCKLLDKDFNIADAMTKPLDITRKFTLGAILAEGLVDSGYPQPTNLDKSELLVRIAINPITKQIPGAHRMYETMTEKYREIAIRKLREKGEMGMNEIDENKIVAKFVKMCITKKKE